MLFLVLMIAGLGGCASEMHTPSGRPETGFSAPSKEDAETRVITFFVNGGFVPSAPDRLTLRFEREGDFLMSFFFGTDWDARAFYRVDVTVLPTTTPHNYRVLALPIVVGNHGTGYERQHELTGAGYAALQAMLDELRDGAERPYNRNVETKPAK